MIELSTWNLCIPVGTPAMTIDTAQLLDGYQDDYFSPGNTLTFWAPVTGSTTANAKYPRSELRETKDGCLHNWSCADAHHFLRAALQVTQVPASGKIVIGQIHCANSTQPLLKVEYQYKSATQNGEIVAKFRRSPDAEIEVISLAQRIALRQRFSYSLHLSPGGTLSVNTCDQHWEASLDRQWQGLPLYFKAGVYTQDNTGCDTDGGRATFYELSIEHRPRA